MPFSLIRFNLIDPTLDSQSLSDRYKAMLYMAEFADQNWFFMATFEEHHGADPLIFFNLRYIEGGLGVTTT